MDIKLSAYVEEYKQFMGIDGFPKYDLHTHEVSLIAAESKGFDSVASAHFQPQTNQHILSVATNINITKHVMYHEFTHMLDSEMFVKGDKTRYAGLSGFTEYHASQVELMQLLGASDISRVSAFSMGTNISTFSGCKSVSRYVSDKYQHAINLFSRDDFPADITSLKIAFGILFNYWGLRSICEMYATDYNEEINNEIFLKYIPSALFTTANRLMHGWLDEEKIELTIQMYLAMLFPLIKQYKLA